MISTKKRFVFCCVLVFTSFLIHSQKTTSLVVAEYRIDSPRVGNYTYLTKYNFESGKLISKDTLFGIEVYDSKKQTSVNCARFDLGENRIHQGRYVISGTGDVVDLQNRSLVTDGDKTLIEVIGDSLLYNEGWGIDEEVGFSFFNLKTRKFIPIPDSTFYTKGGWYSPDYRHSLQNSIYEPAKSRTSFNKIILHGIDDSGRVIVPYCEPTRRTSDFTMGFPDIPMIWIDNETFLYAEYPLIYSKQGYQSSKMVLINRMNITSLKKETIALLDSVLPDRSNGLFKRDNANNIIFYCQKGTYKVDLYNKTLTPVRFVEFGNGFKEDSNYRKGDAVLYYEDQKLSHARGYHYSVSTKGYLATIVSPTGTISENSYLKVWNSVSKEWVTIKIPWICDVIGWIDLPD